LQTYFSLKYNHLLYFCLNDKSGREKNSTGGQNVPKPFYGPPTNCSDLGKLGYTLNGYYLVNGAKIQNQIEVVLCRFQLAPGENESIFQNNILINKK